MSETEVKDALASSGSDAVPGLQNLPEEKERGTAPRRVRDTQVSGSVLLGAALVLFVLLGRAGTI